MEIAYIGVSVFLAALWCCCCEVCNELAVRLSSASQQPSGRSYGIKGVKCYMMLSN